MPITTSSAVIRGNRLREDGSIGITQIDHIKRWL
jgi:hypothetical protein